MKKLSKLRYSVLLQLIFSSFKAWTTDLCSSQYEFHSQVKNSFDYHMHFDFCPGNYSTKYVSCYHLIICVFRKTNNILCLYCWLSNSINISHSSSNSFTSWCYLFGFIHTTWNILYCHCFKGDHSCAKNKKTGCKKI
jgi:hypothetical protein